MKKKIIISVVVLMATAILAFVIAAMFLFWDIVKAAGTIEKREEKLYSMEFDGDYGFDEFLKRGGAASDEELADYLVEFLSKGFYKNASNLNSGEFACSTLAVNSGENDFMLGRNYDWAECQAMIVKTKPKVGYASVSTCCLDFLGFGEDFVPDADMASKMMSLAAVYVPLDGMNEKGLIVADLIAGDKEVTKQQTGKVKLTTTTAIRLLLDRAATVDEAVELLKNYDMNSSIGSAHHLSIADATGKSAVIEYVGGEMFVTETKVVTNHYLSECEKQGTGSEQSHQRYETLMSKYEECGGKMDFSSLCDAMKSVAQYNYRAEGSDYEKTMWTVIYIPKEGKIHFYFDEKYDDGYEIKIK